MARLERKLKMKTLQLQAAWNSWGCPLLILDTNYYTL